MGAASPWNSTNPITPAVRSTVALAEHGSNLTNTYPEKSGTVLADLSTVLHSGSEFEKNPRSKLADFLTACCKFQLGLETFFDPRPPRVMLHSRRATYAGFFGPLFFLWN